MEFWDVINTNIYGTWLCMKKEINIMLKNSNGSIVNCSSINGIKGNPNYPIYSASKHAIIGLTKSAAISYAKNSIRINAIAPGPTETNISESSSACSALCECHQSSVALLAQDTLHLSAQMK